MKRGGNPVRFAGRTGFGRASGRLTSCLARLWRDKAAVTSLEFALVALPFFTLILGTFTIGVWYFYSATIDLAVYKTARQLMTGQAQSSGSQLTAASFSTLLCSNMTSFVPCSATNPVIALTVVKDFNNLTTTTTQINNTVNPPVNFTVTTLKPVPAAICSPQQLDVIYIQARYTMPAVYDVVGNTLYSGTTVQIEEFPTTSSVSTNC
jgi:Flp pilus assembly protein TadG